jgi:hypothetical protein
MSIVPNYNAVLRDFLSSRCMVLPLSLTASAHFHGPASQIRN